MTFVTFHILHTLPLHNLNRDQNGLPKSHFDGSVERGRLSSQSLKQAARTAYRAQRPLSGIRTRHAEEIGTEHALAYAAEIGAEVDPKAVKQAIARVIRAMTNDPKKDEEKAAKKKSAKAPEELDAEAEAEVDTSAMILLSATEITTFARTVVDGLVARTKLDVTDLVIDSTSASLDIAAFGRMFANQTALGTHAAVAVSHAVTTHPMALVSDYFTAVDDQRPSGGAGHLGMQYYTSGVYYRTFTVDIDQLSRSWSGLSADTAIEDLEILLRACVESLPAGKKNSTNAHTLPTTIVVEKTRSRFAYDFDTPVAPGADGGYKANSIAALAQRRATALDYSSSAFLDTAYLLGETGDIDGECLGSIEELVTAVATEIFNDASAAAAARA